MILCFQRIFTNTLLTGVIVNLDILEDENKKISRIQKNNPDLENRIK